MLLNASSAGTKFLSRMVLAFSMKFDNGAIPAGEAKWRAIQIGGHPDHSGIQTVEKDEGTTCRNNQISVNCT